MILTPCQDNFFQVRIEKLGVFFQKYHPQPNMHD